ncbi:hypothetical protein [Streptomyces sp. NPDC053427]|uniref:hypothetical protein n=1 Tax=Streptomyces sp. NPDC053427 TaxID=3365701 RepID=UPI0037D232E0
MGKLTRAAIAGLMVLGAGLAAVPAAQAAQGQGQGQGCRYYYTSWGQGPNGETTGYGDYNEGDHDPEGRVCHDGWWESEEGQGDGGY